MVQYPEAAADMEKENVTGALIELQKSSNQTVVAFASNLLCRLSGDAQAMPLPSNIAQMLDSEVPTIDPPISHPCPTHQSSLPHPSAILAPPISHPCPSHQPSLPRPPAILAPPISLATPISHSFPSDTVDLFVFVGI